MIPLSPTIYAAAGAAVLIAALSGAAYVQTERLKTAKAETVAVQSKFDLFVAQAKAVGDAQNAKAAAQALIDQQLKEKADAESKGKARELADLYAAYRKLRNDKGSGPDRSLLPAALAGAADPARACFDRAALDSAISALDRGVTSLLEKGDAAVAAITSSRLWARELSSR